MGQESSAPANAPRADRPARRTRPPNQASQHPKTQSTPHTLVGHEEERTRVPTLKEQWQARREANARIREANAAERQQKMAALHAALTAQRSQSERRENERKGDSDEEDDVTDLRLRQAAAEAEAALTAAQVSAQLAAFQALMQNSTDVELELESVDGNPVSTYDRDVALKAAKGHGHSGGNAARSAADEDEIPDEVSVHSSDYENEELLQGLNDLDDELEAEFQQNIESLQAQVAEYKQMSLACLRERNDKAAALLELQKAKAVEAQIKQLLDTHAEPLRLQIERQEKKIVELEELVAAHKQEALTAMRAGDKPTALEKLTESKGFQRQLDEAKARLAELEAEKARQLRSTGES
ncbi:hypothetical protein ABL78_2090 [Leptomonas seymouri]|uniref:Uncharacterized protein n=1 Tax=Leptomonas seymouri TaxID=5684 RepID=A0A0N1PCL3_LEPSE|nr:hypothetical protein ABL78_2090 [Leptomonas seymouri]|eukprot:KPI88775.1 hypothetical protein ABL78_2090 [Leptomonas seymouri]